MKQKVFLQKCFFCLNLSHVHFCMLDRMKDCMTAEARMRWIWIAKLLTELFISTRPEVEFVFLNLISELHTRMKVGRCYGHNLWIKICAVALKIDTALCVHRDTKKVRNSPSLQPVYTFDLTSTPFPNGKTYFILHWMSVIFRIWTLSF